MLCANSFQPPNIALEFHLSRWNGLEVLMVGRELSGKFPAAWGKKSPAADTG